MRRMSPAPAWPVSIILMTRVAATPLFPGDEAAVTAAKTAIVPSTFLRRKGFGRMSRIALWMMQISRRWRDFKSQMQHCSPPLSSSSRLMPTVLQAAW